SIAARFTKQQVSRTTSRPAFPRLCFSLGIGEQRTLERHLDHLVSAIRLRLASNQTTFNDSARSHPVRSQEPRELPLTNYVTLKCLDSQEQVSFGVLVLGLGRLRLQVQVMLGRRWAEARVAEVIPPHLS